MNMACALSSGCSMRSPIRRGASARGAGARRLTASRCGRSTARSPRAARTSISTWARWSPGRARPASGTPKHPPLGAWLVGAWFRVFPLADWAYYLFAMVLATLALWVAWRVSERYLDGEKRVVGLLLLTLMPFFNFHALKFNANTVLIPLWAATTWCFLRSYETRRARWAALAGLGGRRRHARQVLVDLPARGPRHRGARRSAPRRLFPLGGAVGDDRGRRDPARAACGLARSRIDFAPFTYAVAAHPLDACEPRRFGGSAFWPASRAISRRRWCSR